MRLENIPEIESIKSLAPQNTKHSHQSGRAAQGNSPGNRVGPLRLVSEELFPPPPPPPPTSRPLPLGLPSNLPPGCSALQAVQQRKLPKFQILGIVQTPSYTRCTKMANPTEQWNVPHASPRPSWATMPSPRPSSPMKRRLGAQAATVPGGRGPHSSFPNYRSQGASMIPAPSYPLALSSSGRLLPSPCCFGWKRPGGVSEKV